MSATLDASLAPFGFGPRLSVAGRASVADLFPKNDRCGLYVLEFADGAIYAGLAVDVVRRFGQHRKTHGDIVGIRFCKLAAASLAQFEAELIPHLEAEGHRMRNFALMSVVAGERGIDLLISPDDQEAWMRGFELKDGAERVADEALRARYQARFEKFERTLWAADAIELLRLYARRMLPRPRVTELSFWCVSCLPSFRMDDATLLARVNLNMMEVASVIGDADGVYMTFHVAESPLEELGPRTIEQLTAAGYTDDEGYLYAPGGGDQRVLWGGTRDRCLALLGDATVIRAVRTMNMRLMRKGPSYYSKYHCLPLADRLLDRAP